MADKTVTPLDPSGATTIRYELGRANWAPAAEDGHPWMPAAVHGDAGTIRLNEDQVIDILILGDGYETRSQFEDRLAIWLDEFFDTEVYDTFCGAFRIRALFTPSPEACTTNRHTHYGVKVDDDGRIEGDGWWNADTSRGRRFREALFDAVDRYSVNLARYPSSLEVGGDRTVIHNELKGLYSNLVVMMLARSQTSSGGTIANASGMTRRVRRRAGTYLNVGFGSHSLHEFGHAFAYLEDEYISDRGSQAGRANPTTRSVFTLSNLAFSDRIGRALWLHISPWGLSPRVGAGSDPSPIVGWLWRGGEHDRRVWHSEYQCLMNGRHQNYAYTPDAAADPTASPPTGCNRFDAGEGGADLRWRDPPRYCFWCEEIVVIRILEKTGQLALAEDSANINSRGRIWYERWVAEGRRHYWALLDVANRIALREALYAAPATEPGSFCQIINPDGSYRRLDRSDLYRPFDADGPVPTASPALGDDELLVMLNA
jgi:hypothetical protein